jgi:hypothetical protein
MMCISPIERYSSRPFSPRSGRRRGKLPDAPEECPHVAGQQAGILLGRVLEAVTAVSAA